MSKNSKICIFVYLYLLINVYSSFKSCFRLSDILVFLTVTNLHKENLCFRFFYTMSLPTLPSAPSFSVHSVAESSGAAISEAEEIQEVQSY